ncbi:hypothetical protein FLM9_876 [Candidatus Synechococcus spongiarum]|uniref:Uncharacterized protein n=1 Tax=Candidatus Synechococcus spongiarum TaxID=431041 RepID=A0A165B0X1_9SYNE|nr:hypothetical protein FLM9_876 [Candidatus Synechococcus spongiarum]
MRTQEQVLNKHGILGHGQTHWKQGLWVSFMFRPHPPARLLENPLITLLTATGLVSTLTFSCVVALC